MRAASDARASSQLSRRLLIVSTALMCVLAAAAACLGSAFVLAVVVADAPAGAGAVGAAAVYVLAAYGAPIAAGRFLASSRRWDQLRAIRLTATTSVLVNVAVLLVVVQAVSL